MKEAYIRLYAVTVGKKAHKLSQLPKCSSELEVCYSSKKMYAMPVNKSRKCVIRVIIPKYIYPIKATAINAWVWHGAVQCRYICFLALCTLSEKLASEVGHQHSKYCNELAATSSLQHPDILHTPFFLHSLSGSHLTRASMADIDPEIFFNFGSQAFFDRLEHVPRNVDVMEIYHFQVG